MQEGSPIEAKGTLGIHWYPLANNQELNAPDSVLRLAEGYRLVMTEDDNRFDYKIYYVEKEDDNNPT